MSPWLWLTDLSSVASAEIETVVGVESGEQKRGRAVGEKLYMGTGNVAQLAVAGSAFTSKLKQAVCPKKLLAKTILRNVTDK